MDPAAGRRRHLQDALEDEARRWLTDQRFRPDTGTGLNADTFRVTADGPLAGAAAGENLAPRLRSPGGGVWELALPEPVRRLPAAPLTVSVADRRGNVTRVERRFRVGP